MSDSYFSMGGAALAVLAANGDLGADAELRRRADRRSRAAPAKAPPPKRAAPVSRKPPSSRKAPSSRSAPPSSSSAPTQRRPAPAARPLTMAGVPVTKAQLRATIDRLKQLQDARAAGYKGYLTTDPEWLVDMAINRRAGWAEDLHSHGSVNARKQPRTEAAKAKLRARGELDFAPGAPGSVPRRATGDAQRLMEQLGRRINARVVVVRETELGEWGPYLRKRLPDRFVRRGDED